MSERFTGIYLPGVFGSGLANYGRRSAEEMIAYIRKQAAADKAVADAILNANDEDFRVETYVGAVVERRKQVIQEGRARTAMLAERSKAEAQP